MMTPALCPEEDVLLALALGDPVDVEVEAHTSTCPDCRQRLARLGSEVALLRRTTRNRQHDTVSQPVAAAPTAAESPAVIGKYFIVGTLGRGGQAQVYRALHPTLGRDVVIKLSHEPVGDSEADRDWLVAEGRLLAELEHPNLARIYDLDFHEGKPFLVMEYIRGRSLEQAMKEDRFTSRQAAGLVARLARAVGAAHRRGITHQDITPRNVLIDEAGQPRLIDFGLARLRRPWDTAAGQPVGGTPGFMAPEQARGEADRITAQSDIFALGGLLFFLLTGQPPFPGSQAYLVQQQTSSGRVDLLPLRLAKVPGRLAAICARALAGEPTDRYRSADAMADDLDRFLRRPRRWLLLAATGLAVLLVFGAGSWLLRPPGPAVHNGSEPILGQFPQGPQYLIEVGDDRVDLKSAVPLHSGVDLHISCLIPHGFHAALFSIDSMGKVEHYADATVAPAGAFDRLSFPARLEGPSGTELLLVCASRTHAPAAADVAPLFAGEQWPPLPDRIVVRLDRDRVQVERGRGHLESRTRLNATEKVEASLEKISIQLQEHFEFFVGVAYPHR